MRLSNSLNPRGLPQCLHESYQTPFCYATIDIRTNINEATFCYRISSRKRSAYAVSWLTNNIQSHSYAPLREGQQTFSQTQHLFQENIKKVLSFVEGKKMPPSFSSQEGVSAGEIFAPLPSGQRHLRFRPTWNRLVSTYHFPKRPHDGIEVDLRYIIYCLCYLLLCIL